MIVSKIEITAQTVAMATNIVVQIATNEMINFVVFVLTNSVAFGTMVLVEENPRRTT
jgi:hypothetical protein